MDSSSEPIRVLHVEDDSEFAEMAAQFITRNDDRLVFETALSPSEGMDRLHQADFDCIVSDYDMPEQDGLEFLKRIRSEHPNLPFILFTGKGSEEIASDAISAGVTDYIQKEVGTDQYSVVANQIVNSVERYRAIRQTELGIRAMETANEGISLVEPDGTFSYVNSAFADLFGHEPDELEGKHWRILYHNEEAQRLENDILPAVRETGYWAGETVRVTKDGERLVTDHRLAHTDEGVTVCTAQDVTQERMDTEKQMTGFDLFIDAMEEYAFYTTDHEGYVTRWNEGAERLKGFEASEVLGEHISTFFTEEDREQGLPEELIETAKSEGSVTDEGWRLRKDGSKFWATVTLSSSFDESGTIRGFGKIIQEAPDQGSTGSV